MIHEAPSTIGVPIDAIECENASSLHKISMIKHIYGVISSSKAQFAPKQVAEHQSQNRARLLFSR
jgi:hypothetical protein